MLWMLWMRARCARMGVGEVGAGLTEMDGGLGLGPRKEMSGTPWPEEGNAGREGQRRGREEQDQESSSV